VLEVNRWFSLFLYDDSLGLYEKALENISKDPASAEEDLQKVLRGEPYNKVALQTYVSFLIDQKRVKEAKEQIENTARQMPFLSIFETYASYVSLMGDAVMATIPAVSGCEKRGFNEVETDFCNLTRLISQVKTGQDVKKLAAKITLPDAKYWLWMRSKNPADLKAYLTLCQTLSGKVKKSYRIVPSVCAKMQDAEKHLKPAVKKDDGENSQSSDE